MFWELRYIKGNWFVIPLAVYVLGTEFPKYLSLVWENASTWNTGWIQNKPNTHLLGHQTLIPSFLFKKVIFMNKTWYILFGITNLFCSISTYFATLNWPFKAILPLTNLDNHTKSYKCLFWKNNVSYFIQNELN